MLSDTQGSGGGGVLGFTVQAYIHLHSLTMTTIHSHVLRTLQNGVCSKRAIVFASVDPRAYIEKNQIASNMHTYWEDVLLIDRHIYIDFALHILSLSRQHSKKFLVHP